jgi:hypothetical protein
MDVQCLSDSPSRRMNLSHRPHPALAFVIPSDLAVSVAVICVSCRVIGILFARVSLTKWRTAAPISGRLPFFGLVKFLVVALHANVEAWAFLQRRTFVSLIFNLRSAALVSCSAFSFNAAS